MRNDLTPLDTALALLARGLWPVAIHPPRVEIITKDGPKIAKGKEPIGTDWGATRPTEASLRAVYAAHPGAGVGIRLGPEAGVIDCEVDGPEGVASLHKILLGEPLTLGWTSRRGPHYLFRYNAELAKYGKNILRLKTDLPGLEIRIAAHDGKQFQSCCPPTVAEDGQSRQWNDCDEIAELPPSVFVYLDEYTSRPAEPAPPAPAPHGSFPAIGGTTLPVEERAIRYLATVEPAIQGHDGSGKTFGAACRVGPGFDLDQETAFRLLRDHYSPRCVPPWSETELRHKVEDAYKNEPRRGWLKDALPPGASSGSPSVKRTGRCANDPDDDDAPIVLPEWPAPPGPDAYHGLAGDIVRAIEPRSEADPAALLVQLLVAFGSVVGRNAHVGVGATWHHANEFALMVGETSAARKGTSWSEVFRFVAAVDPEWRDKRILGGLSTGAGLIYHVRDPLEGKEAIREKGKITGYQDVILDHGVSDKRLLVIETEFGGVLKVSSREGNNLSAVMRQGWDGSTLASMTKSFPYRATGAHVSIIGHITADELTRLLSQCDQANGFANRFLWACCRRSKLLPFGGRVPQDEVDRLRQRLEHAAAFARAAEMIKWTREAMDLWEDAYSRLTAARPGALGMVTRRAEAHALRLALLYSLLDGSDQIEPEHLRAALAVWDYCHRSAVYVFGTSSGDRDADRVLQALRAEPDGLTRNQIRSQVFGGHKDAEYVASKLSILLRLELLRSEMVPTAGRPAERWFAQSRDVCACAISAENTPPPTEPNPYRAFRAGAALSGVAPATPNSSVSSGPINPADPLGIAELLDEPAKPIYVDSAGVASREKPTIIDPSQLPDGWRYYGCGRRADRGAATTGQDRPGELEEGDI
jgi:hypothetical protein